jgi:transketolase
MMLAPALKASDAAATVDIDVGIVYVPVIKPIDAGTVIEAAKAAKGIVTAENHSIIGGLGSAVAEVLAEAGLGTKLRRVGVEDRFATAGSRPYLFREYGLSSSRILERIWDLLSRDTPPPSVTEVEFETGGAFEPV